MIHSEFGRSSGSESSYSVGFGGGVGGSDGSKCIGTVSEAIDACIDTVVS